MAASKSRLVAAMMRTLLVIGFESPTRLEDPVAGIVVGRLEDPQELGLHGRVALADLVQEQRPAVGLLERPVPVLDRPR